MILKTKVNAMVFQRGIEPKCAVCDSVVDLTNEHIIPQRRGGGNHPHNRAILCHFCNSSKSHRTPQEWLDWYEGKAELYLKHLLIYKKLKSKMGKSKEIVEKLRNLYREKKFAEMKKYFYTNIFFIETEDRARIWGIVRGLKGEDDPRYKNKTDEHTQLQIDMVLKEFKGSKIVDE